MRTLYRVHLTNGDRWVVGDDRSLEELGRVLGEEKAIAFTGDIVFGEDHDYGERGAAVLATAQIAGIFRPDDDRELMNA